MGEYSKNRFTKAKSTIAITHGDEDKSLRTWKSAYFKIKKRYVDLYITLAFLKRKYNIPQRELQETYDGEEVRDLLTQFLVHERIELSDKQYKENVAANIIALRKRGYKYREIEKTIGAGSSLITKTLRQANLINIRGKK